VELTRISLYTLNGFFQGLRDDGTLVEKCSIGDYMVNNGKPLVFKMNEVLLSAQATHHCHDLDIWFSHVYHRVIPISLEKVTFVLHPPLTQKSLFFLF